MGQSFPDGINIGQGGSAVSLVTDGAGGITIKTGQSGASAPIAAGVAACGNTSITGTLSITGAATLSSAASTVVVGGGTGTATLRGTIKTGVTLQTNALGALIADLYTLPANSLGAGRWLKVRAWASTAANANTKTLSINFAGTGAVNAAVVGGTSLVSASTGVASEVLRAEATIIRTGASTQAYLGQPANGSTFGAGTAGTLAVVDTAAIQINLVINNVTAATDTTAYWTIEWGN